MRELPNDLRGKWKFKSTKRIMGNVGKELKKVFALCR
jgi:hypothetical protein